MYNNNTSIIFNPLTVYSTSQWRYNHLVMLDGTHLLNGFFFNVDSSNPIAIRVFLGRNTCVGCFAFFKDLAYRDSLQGYIRLTYYPKSYKYKECFKYEKELTEGKLSIKMLYDIVMKHI